MFAPSTMAWAQVWSSVSAAALKASQISFRPSNAGAVSQNSSLLLRSWPSVSGISEVHGGRSFFSGWFRPTVTAKKHNKRELKAPSFASAGTKPEGSANYSKYKTVHVTTSWSTTKLIAGADSNAWISRCSHTATHCNGRWTG